MGVGAIYGIVLLVLIVICAPVLAVLIYKANRRDKHHPAACSCHQCRQARHTVDVTCASNLENASELSITCFLANDAML